MSELVPPHLRDSDIYHVHLRGGNKRKAVRGWRACQGGNNLGCSFVEYNFILAEDAAGALGKLMIDGLRALLPDSLGKTGDAALVEAEKSHDHASFKKRLTRLFHALALEVGCDDATKAWRTPFTHPQSSRIFLSLIADI